MLLQILLVIYKTEQNRDSDGLGPPKITDNSNAQLKQQHFFSRTFFKEDT